MRNREPKLPPRDPEADPLDTPYPEPLQGPPDIAGPEMSLETTS